MDEQAALELAIAKIHAAEYAAGERRLRQILRDNPNSPVAQATLARLLVMIGRADEAARLLAVLEASADREPRIFGLLGEAYLQAKRPGEALRAFTALARATSAPDADVGRVEALLRLGRVEEAIVAARRIVATIGVRASTLSALGPVALCAKDEPLYAECCRVLASLPGPHAASILEVWTDTLAGAERFGESVRTCTELVARAPTSSRLCLLAELMLGANDRQGATEAARRALELTPHDAAALTTLARCHIVAGQASNARALLEEVIEKNPDFVNAYDHLSHLDARALDETKRKHLAALMRRSAGARYARMALALGRAEEAAGAYPAAFAHYVSAKAETRREARSYGADYDPALTERMVRTLLFAFNGPQEAPQILLRPTPVFIVGLPRSGTTLTEQILAAHPSVAAGGELGRMYKIFGVMLARLFAGARLASLLKAEGPAWAAHYGAAAPTSVESASSFTDKHPLNFWAVGLIFSLFANAHVIHVQRDLRDTAMSIFTQRFGMEYRFANDLDSLAHMSAAYERLMAHWRAVFGARLHVMSYEALVADLEPNARALVAHCGLEWDEACLDFHRSEREIFTHSAAQVRKPVTLASVGRWRRFETELAPFEEALGRYRARFERLGAGLP